MAKPPKWVNDSSLASSFLLEADRDYVVGRLISYAGANFAGRGWYFAQQALEKYLKAVSVQRNGGYWQTHDLKILAEECAKTDPDFADAALVADLSFFDSYAEVGRYGAAAMFDPTKSTASGITVSAVVPLFPQHRDRFDFAVFTIRRKIDFLALNFPDNFMAVTNGDQSTLFVADWKLPIPLKEILTHENRYFR